MKIGSQEWAVVDVRRPVGGEDYIPVVSGAPLDRVLRAGERRLSDPVWPVSVIVEPINPRIEYITHTREPDRDEVRDLLIDALTDIVKEGLVK